MGARTSSLQLFAASSRQGLDHGEPEPDGDNLKAGARNGGLYSGPLSPPEIQLVPYPACPPPTRTIACFAYGITAR
jgi:hypothetical protein